LGEEENSFIGSAPPLGAIIGTLFGAICCYHWGRKKVFIAVPDSLPYFCFNKVMIGSCLVMLLGLIASPFMTYYQALCAVRLVMGVGLGGISISCPLYIAEMAPPSVRGFLISLFQVSPSSCLFFSNTYFYFFWYSYLLLWVSYWPTL